MNKKERLLLFTLVGIQFCHTVDFILIMPLGPTFMRSFSITPQEFSWLISSYTFSAGIFGIIASFFVDNFDRKFVLSLSYLGFIFGTFFCASVNSYDFLVLSRILLGAFVGVLSASILAIVGDVIPFERRGKATGAILSAFPLASVIGIPIGLFLSVKYSWRVPFYVISFLSICLLLFTQFTFPNIKTHLQYNKNQSSLKKIIDILKEPNALISFGLIVAIIFGGFSVIPFISPYLVANVKILESDLTYIYLVGGGVTFFSANLIGYLSDQFGKKLIFSIVAFLSIFPLLLITNLPVLSLHLVITSTTLFFILVSGRVIPAMALITSSISTEKRGGFMSINSSIQQIASGFASFISGLIIGRTQQGELINYWKVGILAICSTFVSIYLAQKIKLTQEE